MNPNPSTPPAFYFVFDCESIGLHGDTFAVGWTVIDGSGKEHAFGLLVSDPKDSDGSADDRKWIAENVPTMEPNCTRDDIRMDFWLEWLDWKERGAVMVTDCGWPVETQFLSDCVYLDYPDRKWGGPYPLIDLSSILLARCYNPTHSFERLPTELPAHNPLNDARQSARVLIEVL